MILAAVDLREPSIEVNSMERRRLAVLGAVVVLAVATALVRVLAPGRYEAILDRGADVVERAPEPVVVAATVLVLLAVGIFLLIQLARLSYWVWLRIRGRVLWVWNALLPKSPIVRFGVGLTIMVLVFLVGPLVVLQALDVFENTEDPIEQQQNDSDDLDNETDGTNGNSTTDGNDTTEGSATGNPDDPDEPPDAGTGDSGDGSTGNSTDG